MLLRHFFKESDLYQVDVMTLICYELFSRCTMNVCGASL
jgi:hypothetical protein